MKKYGDDADQFHNQGTRVEASKKWHEKHQLRHDYSYRSPSKPKSTYKPKPSYKPKSNYKSKSTYKPKSSYKPKSNYRRTNSNNSSYRSNNSGSNGRYYGTGVSNPYVARRKEELKKQKRNYQSNSKSDDDWVVCLGVLLFFLFIAFMFYLMFGDIMFR